MLGGLGDITKIGAMLKQAMEMKSRIEEIKAGLAKERISGASGGGMVTVEMSGDLELLSLKIDPEVVNKDDVEMLETLIRAAVNDTLTRARELVKQKMTEVAGGLDIPGLT